jgi:hypothetical protein
MLRRGVVAVEKAKCRSRSAEGEGHEARAEKDQAAGSQRQEAIRYEVMVAHGTPATLVFDARSDRLKMSERAALKEVMLADRASASGPRAVTFKRMGQEDPRAYQTHQCRNRLDHR